MRAVVLDDSVPPRRPDEPVRKDRAPASRSAQRMSDRMRAVAAATARVVGAATPEEARRALEAVAREVVPLGGFDLLTYDPTDGTVAPFGLDAPAIAVAGSPWEAVVARRQPVVDGEGGSVRVPVLSGDDLLGVLSVEGAVGGGYTADDVEVVETVASLAAAVLSIHRLAAARRAAEQGQALSDRRFRAVFDQLPLSMQVFDPEGWTLDVNRAWHDVFGLPPEVLEAFNPLQDPQLADVRALLDRGFGGETVTIPPHLFDAGALHGGESRPRWLEVTVCPVRDDAGGVREVILLHRDATAQVDAETALHQARHELERRVEERTAELAEAEARFRALVEASPVPLILSDAREGTIFFANDRLEQLVGVAPGTLVGQRTPDFYYDPSDRPGVIARVQEQGYVRGAELRIKRADGTPRWVSLNVQQLVFDGAPALATALVDVTERKEAEEALRGRTEELEAVFRALPDLYFRMEADGTILDYRAGRQFGLYAPPEEFLGRRVQDVLPAPVGARIGAALADVARTGGLVQFEYGLPLGDVPMHFEARLLPLADAQVIAVVRDVTERVRSEAALRESEASYRSLFDTLTELVYIQDFDGRFFNVNEAVVRAYGYAREEIIGQTPDLLAAPGTVDPAVFAETFAKAVAGEPQRFEWWGRRKDGSTFPKEVVIQRSTYFGEDVVLAVARDTTEQKAAEASLRASEEHFRRLIETSHDLVQTLDTNGQIMYTGPSVERLLGYTPEELTGKGAPNFIHPDDQPLATAKIAEALTHPGELVHLEYRVLHKDGRWRWFEALGRTLAPDTAEHGMVANARDITDRKEAERALQEREEHFRRLIENAYDMVLVMDMAGTITYASPSAQRVLGTAPEELTGRSGFSLVHPDDADVALARTTETVDTPGTVVSAELRLRHRDGSYRILETFCRTVADDSAAKGIVVNARDATERVEAERALQFQKTLLEAEGEASIDGILVVSPEGQILSCNDRFAEMWGIPGAVVGAGSDQAALQAVTDRVVDPETFLARVEHLYAHPDEEARDEVLLTDGRVFDRYSAPVRSQEGDHYGRIWFFRDVTVERRRARELEAARREAERALVELRDAQEQLVHQEKMAGLGRLTAGIAHELKNPLNFVNNFSLINAELVPDIREAIDGGDRELFLELLADVEMNSRKVHEHGQRADGIVRRMMEHVRTGAEGTERRPLDLNAVVEAEVAFVVESRRRTSPAFAAPVELDLDDRVGAVEAVPAEIGRVVQTIVANALDAVEARSAGADGPYAPCVTVRTRRDGAAVRLSVTDNGEGIAEEVRDRMFEPFFTTRPVGSRHLGLGLSLAHETVVAGYGGGFTVESEAGRGATVTVTLPAP